MDRKILRTGLAALLLLVIILLMPQSVYAASTLPRFSFDGLIIPMPCPEPDRCPGPSPMVQLEIKYHRVEITIDEQIATTHVDQVFYNPNEWVVEGTYVFPLPVDAAVTSFTLWVDGKPVKGDVLDAEKARQVYEQIVSSLRDPALLEYAGRGAVKASIFPIAPHGERRIELEYTQVLVAEGGLVNLNYPLNTEKFSLRPLEQVSVSVDIRSTSPIRAVYSPSHSLAIERSSDNHVRASFEASNVLPDSDFSLYYSLGETQAFHLLSFRDPIDQKDQASTDGGGASLERDGFFLLMLAPSLDEEIPVLSKDIILVLDHSGSMEGEKFAQAQEAARYILKHLNPNDTFNLVAFNDGVETYAPDLRPASEASQAIGWVDRLSAVGGTDINRALLEAAALVNPDLSRGTRETGERPAYIIFMTDGLPTVGVVESESILADFSAAAPEHLRLFAFGVGYDVDTFLLDSLAQQQKGISFYVLPEERLDEALSTFYTKIRTPVLTDLELDFGDMLVYDLYPSPLPDLFRGSQIIIVGRYREGGTADVGLIGRVEGVDQSFVFPDQSFNQTSRPGDPLGASLPRLWATRKIGYLLQQIRLHGADQNTADGNIWVDQIVRLSIRYGIVTPYTSYLVTADQPLGEEALRQIVLDSATAMRMPMPASGQAAIQKASGEQMLSMAESASESQSLEGMDETSQPAGRVRSAGSRTFILQGSTWIDTAFDPETMLTKPTAKVAFLSPDYFSLVKAKPELAAAFALGPSVIVLSGETAYEVVLDDASAQEIFLPEESNSPLETEPPVSLILPGDPGPSIANPSSGSDSAQSPPNSSGPIPCLGGLVPLLLFLLWIQWSVWNKRSDSYRL